MELIQAIAALCAISIGAMGMDTKKVDEAQLKCQQYYVECVGKSLMPMNGLLLCIRKGKYEKTFDKSSYLC